MMTVALDILAARARLYRAYPTATSVAYVRDNELDMRQLADAAGCFTVMRVAVSGDRFEFSETGNTIVAIVEAFGRDGETSVDLVAWPLDAPQRVLTMFGRTPILGLVNVFAATTYAFDRPLVCYRTPLAWWQAGCRGAVVLDPSSAARLLLDAPGLISGEDLEHSRQIAELVRSLFDPARFVAPAQSERRAA